MLLPCLQPPRLLLRFLPAAQLPPPLKLYSPLLGLLPLLPPSLLPAARQQ